MSRSLNNYIDGEAYTLGHNEHGAVFGYWFRVLILFPELDYLVNCFT